MKNIYLAAPFFTPMQLELVQEVEKLISTIPGLTYFSPRSEGVLKDMTAEERAASMQRIFQSNVDHIQGCDCLLAILDHKDTGTTWELGMAYGMNSSGEGKLIGEHNPIKIFGFTGNPLVEINVMLKKCLHAHAAGMAELKEMLTAYSEDRTWDKHQIGDTF